MVLLPFIDGYQVEVISEGRVYHANPFRVWGVYPTSLGDINPVTFGEKCDCPRGDEGNRQAEGIAFGVT